MRYKRIVLNEPHASVEGLYDDRLSGWTIDGSPAKRKRTGRIPVERIGLLRIISFIRLFVEKKRFSE